MPTTRNPICSAMVSILAMAVFPGSAIAQDGKRYDPTACQEDAHGKLYIALGRSVLAVPSGSTAVVVGKIYPGMDYQKFPSPNPADPLGCPGNPDQLQSYAWLFTPATPMALKIKSNENDAAPDMLQLIRIGDGDTISSIGEIDWSGEDIVRDTVESDCTRAQHVESILKDGSIVCRVPRADGTKDVDNWAASYKYDIKSYSTPGMHQFVADCGPGLRDEGIGYCEVAYVMSTAFGITYRFQPYLGPHPIPIDRLIEFDRELRRQVKAALVTDYVWADQASRSKP